MKEATKEEEEEEEGLVVAAMISWMIPSLKNGLTWRPSSCLARKESSRAVVVREGPRQAALALKAFREEEVAAAAAAAVACLEEGGATSRHPETHPEDAMRIGNPFSEQQRRGGDSSSGRSGYNGYGGSSGGGGGDDGAAPPPRDDPLAVIQWSLRKAHRRLAPLPGKLAKMREWWDSVGTCGDLNKKQQIVGAELFDRAELHLAKMLSEATELMDAIRQHQQRQDAGNEGKKGKGKQKEKGHWYSKLGSRKNKKTNEKGSTGSKKKKTDKWANAAAQLGRDSEAVLNELVALDMCAAHDDLDEFFAALGDIKSGAGSDNREGTADDDDDSEEDESSADENSEDESSGESSSSSSTD
ncbi:hypothetical protein PG987_015859 [Apiospora arundinis]